MSKRITFAGKLEGELAEPADTGKTGALVLIQEWWGINDHVRSLVDRFAKDGFVVLAPDLYHGRVTKDSGEAGKWMGELDKPKAIQEIGQAIAHLKEHPRSNGKVGVLGFCMGGALTFASAGNLPGIAAAVAFYGLPGELVKDWSKVTAPIQAHFAKKDGWATPAGAQEIKDAIDKAGKTTMELHLYDADHAFVNDTRPEVHDPENAKLAWGRAVAFLKKHLA
jgi:carboxymethylenebutenolidase